MKKNKAMRLASALLVLTLLTTCAISSTFAKYVTSANGSDNARVAKWGFQPTTITMTDLFKNAYSNDDGVETVKSAADVIAPGTTGKAKFGFTYGGTADATAPEVAYTFTVSTEGSTIDRNIKDNVNIKWKLDNGEWSSWDDLLNAIKALSGDDAGNGTKTYKPGELPGAFNTDGANEHTVSWQWKFDENANDVHDTDMGNAANLEKVILNIHCHRNSG